MSVMHTSRLLPLQFFRSSPAPCPYLPGRIERKLFARLSAGEAASTNSKLSQAGFRRSHDIIYKPACPGCMACVPVRVSAAQFTPSENLKRIAQRTAELSITVLPCTPTREQYELFLTYEDSRHTDSDMARMSYDDYAAMLLEGQADTVLLELRTPESELVGVMIADRLSDGYSAVYSFFSCAPVWKRVSLGSALILRLIAQAQADKLGYVYLGYWVQHSRKMAYKARFKPLEALGPNGWQAFTLPEPEKPAPGWQPFWPKRRS
jgi:leucyl-tRNA---protein transferase